MYTYFIWRRRRRRSVMHLPWFAFIDSYNRYQYLRILYIRTYVCVLLYLYIYLHLYLFTFFSFSFFFFLFFFCHQPPPRGYLGGTYIHTNVGRVYYHTIPYHLCTISLSYHIISYHIISSIYIQSLPIYSD